MRVARISFDQLCVRGGGLTWAMPKNSLPKKGKKRSLMKKTTFSFGPCGYIMIIKRQSASAILKSTYVELIGSVWKGKRLSIIAWPCSKTP